ncbi:hypothetical protein DRW07_02165 [Alteromonas sediminis]|uniref:Uncharacterized protein n=1 Tax=Alteromonas sediminis TaxID=2259342 RepID=A0A3N5YEL7_9ALTE|nr:hypothetical protein [Alteromonas sediminis]RPJ68235.1 hypothetical protein DRW07_02165 [Alteromonas sediminis]
MEKQINQSLVEINERLEIMIFLLEREIEERRLKNNEIPIRYRSAGLELVFCKYLLSLEVFKNGGPSQT